MVSMSSLDAISVDDESYEPFHYVDESSQFKNVFVDVSYIKDCIYTLTNEELERMIEHCNMLIERNNIKMGGV